MRIPTVLLRILFWIHFCLLAFNCWMFGLLGWSALRIAVVAVQFLTALGVIAGQWGKALK